MGCDPEEAREVAAGRAVDRAGPVRLRATRSGITRTGSGGRLVLLDAAVMHAG